MNLGIITHNFPNKAAKRQNAGIFVYDLARKLSERNNVTVFTPGDGKTFKTKGIKIINFPIINGKKLGDLSPLNLIDLVRFISYFIGGIFFLNKFQKGRIDVNISMWAFPSGVFAYIAKKIYKTPYFVWCLGSDIYVYAKYPFIGSVIKLVLKSSDFIFADGIDLARRASKISGKKCIFIPSASNISGEIKSKGKNRNKVVLTYVGRIEKIKGIDVLINSLISLDDEISKYRINVVGDGSLLEGITNKIKNADLEKNFRFYGNIANFGQIGSIIKNSDWVVIPSRSDSVPLVFSESMKCGVPVITSDLYDFRYLINKYKVGYTFRNGSTKSLANIIRKLIILKFKQKQFSKNTTNASKDFELDKSVDILLKFLRKSYKL